MTKPSSKNFRTIEEAVAYLDSVSKDQVRLFETATLID
jgi:hypothetical protein